MLKGKKGRSKKENKKIVTKKKVDGVNIYLLQLVEQLALEMVGVLKLKAFKRWWSSFEDSNIK